MKKKGILIFVVLLLSISAIFLAKGMQKKLVSNDIASKTEAKALQSDIKENSSEDSKNSDNGKIQTTDNTNKSSEVKKEETKEVSKTGQQNSSGKTTEAGKQSTEKTAAPKSSNTNTVASTSASPNTSTTQNVNSSTTTQNQSSSLPPNFIVRNTMNNTVIASKHIDFNGETVADITKKNVNCKVKSGDYFYEIEGLKERSEGQLSGWCYYINGSKPGIGAGSYVPKKDDVIEWKFLKDGVNN